MSDKDKKTDPSLFFFKLSVIIFCFILGGIFSQLSLFPFNRINQGLYDTLLLIVENFCPPVILEPKSYKGDGITISQKEKILPGLTLVQGFYNDGPKIQLIDLNGNELNHWQLNFFKIWPNPTHISPPQSIPKTNLSYQSQGIYIAPNGSIVVNINHLGALKMDRFGKVLWTVDRMTHHSVTRSKKGGFWIPAHKNYLDIDNKLFLSNITKDKLAHSEAFYEDIILFVSDKGKVLKEISVLKGVIDAKLEKALVNSLYLNPADPTHTNAVVEVTENLAKKIPGVQIGDLLVSMRNLHMLAIFDVNTGKIKWHQEGPWVYQHAPEITPNGNIRIFNNRRENIYLSSSKGSNILEFNPLTRQSKPLFPPENTGATNKGYFHTRVMGAFQTLANGNLLITESFHGRIFEVTPNNEIVWEYIKPYDSKHMAIISKAERFDIDYFTVENWHKRKTDENNIQQSIYNHSS